MGRTASFGILLAMIADGSSCCLMSDDYATLETNCCQWADNICLVDLLIGRTESVLSGWPVGDFEVSDDDPMLLTANLRC